MWRDLLRANDLEHLAGFLSLIPRTMGGQKPKLGPRQVQLAREMYDSGDYTVQQIADEFGVTRPTIYRHINKALPHQATTAESALERH